MITISAPYLVAVVLIGTALVQAMVRDIKIIIPLAKTRSLTISNASNTDNLIQSKIKKRNSKEMVTDDENFYMFVDETSSNNRENYISPFSELVIKKLFNTESSSEAATNTDSYSEETVRIKSEEPSGSNINGGETTFEATTITQAIYRTDKTSVAYLPTHTVISDNTSETDIPTPSPPTDSNDSTENENEIDYKKENNATVGTFDVLLRIDPTTVTKTSVTTPEDGDDENTYSATTSMTTKDLDPRFCAKYKNGEDINITDMTAIWRVVYYDTAHTVACFKMIINKIYSKDKRRYYKKTIGFTDKIDWENCHAEIIFGVSGRTHVLQKSLLERGVFKNIVFEEDRHGNVTLLEESLDQWMIFKDLLLIRDCNTGEIVVFVRDSKISSRLEVSNALSRFGEDKMEGFWSCNDKQILAQRIRKWIT